MSQETNDDIQEPDITLTGSDADSESSSESTVISVNISSEKVTPKNSELTLYITDESPDKPTAQQAKAERPLIMSVNPKGDTLRQSEIERLRKVFQDKQSHDSENSSDCERSISRCDFSDAESVSSTDMEVVPRPKLLSDYTLDYLHSVRKKDTSERDYMGTKTCSANRTLKLKDRRKSLGKRREPYNLQTDSKLKKSSYLTNVKSDDYSEEKKKKDAGQSTNTPTKSLDRENSHLETLRGCNKSAGLKPVTSKVKSKDDNETTNLRQYKIPTRIPIPKARRDMEGIFKAADDQFNSLDAEISFFQGEMNDYEKETYDKGHTLEVIEESSFETVSKDNVADETLRTNNDREGYGITLANEEMPEVSDTSLGRPEYTVELIEEALNEMSRQTQLEPIEEEQPFMFENKTFRNFVSTGINRSEEELKDAGICSIDCEEQTFSDEQEEEKLESSDNEHGSESKVENEIPAVLRVSLAKSALMKYAAQVKQPTNVNKSIRKVHRVKFDDRLPSENKSVDKEHQDASDTDPNVKNNRHDANSSDVCLAKSTSDEVNTVISCSQIPTETNKTDHVCNENNMEVLSNMMKRIPLEQLSMDDQCVVANISSQQYTLYIKLKNKDTEASSEERTSEVSLIKETPTNMLTVVSCRDRNRCSDGSTSLQIKQPRKRKEAPKVETNENKTSHLRSTKFVQPRVKKTKPTASIIRPIRQRIKSDFPVIHEENYLDKITNYDDIYAREVKRRLSKKVQDGRYNRRSPVALHLQNNFSNKSDSSPKKVANAPSSISKITNLKTWLSMRQKLATGSKTPTNKQPDRRRGNQNNPIQFQTPANSQNSKRSRLITKGVRETRTSLLRRSNEKIKEANSPLQKTGNLHKNASARKQNRKVDNKGTLHSKQCGQSQCEKRRVVKDKPNARVVRISPTFNRQCLDFISPEAWEINDKSTKFAYFCTPSYNTSKRVDKSDFSKFHPKMVSVMQESKSPRANQTTRSKKIGDYEVSGKEPSAKQLMRRERAVDSERKVKEYLERHRNLNTYQRPLIHRRTFSKEDKKCRGPEVKRFMSSRSVDLMSRRPITSFTAATDLGNVWSRVNVSCSKKCVLDAERLKAPIRHHLEQDSVLDKESIAKDALENVFKNLSAYLNALDSSSESSLKTCPAIHFKHTTTGDLTSSEEDIHADDDDEEGLCESDSMFLLSATKEMRLLSVKQKIQKEPLVSDLKWSLLIAACHGYNFDKYLTPFPEHFLLNGRKDIDALMQATEEVPSLSLLCNLSANEISPSAVELLYWLLVDLSSVKVMATSTREAGLSLSKRPDAVFSVWQQPSSMLDRRLRSNGRGLPKVEAFCSARLDKFHALLHGVMVPSGIMRRDIDMAMELAKPGFGYGCSVLGSRIKCIARCQVIVHPRLVELTDDEATVRGRNLVRVQQLLVFRENEVQQTFHLPSWCHVAKILLVVVGLHMAALGLLFSSMWEEPVIEPKLEPDYSEAFPWLASL